MAARTQGGTQDIPGLELLRLVISFSDIALLRLLMALAFLRFLDGDGKLMAETTLDRRVCTARQPSSIITCDWYSVSITMMVPLAMSMFRGFRAFEKKSQSHRTVVYCRTALQQSVAVFRPVHSPVSM